MQNKTDNLRRRKKLPFRLFNAVIQKQLKKSTQYRLFRIVPKTEMLHHLNHFVQNAGILVKQRPCYALP